MLFSMLGRLYAATAALAHCPTACLTVCVCVRVCDWVSLSVHPCSQSVCMRAASMSVHPCIHSVGLRAPLPVCHPSVGEPAVCAWVCSAPVCLCICAVSPCVHAIEWSSVSGVTAAPLNIFVSVNMCFYSVAMFTLFYHSCPCLHGSRFDVLACLITF